MPITKGERKDQMQNTIRLDSRAGRRHMLPEHANLRRTIEACGSFTSLIECGSFTSLKNGAALPH